jgi:hypothetical protein
MVRRINTNIVKSIAAKLKHILTSNCIMNKHAVTFARRTMKTPKAIGNNLFIVGSGSSKMDTKIMCSNPETRSGTPSGNGLFSVSTASLHSIHNIPHRRSIRNNNKALTVRMIILA